MTKLKTLEFEEGPIVANIMDDMSAEGETFADIFADFLGRYSVTVDNILVTRHGNRIVEPEQLEDFGEAYLLVYTIKAYLMERAPWIRQNLAYIDAEYDPIENFIAHEEETITDTMAQRFSLKKNTEKPYSRAHTKEIPQVITEQYTEADVVSETSQLKTTTENMVSPDNTDGYHNQTKAETTPGKITNTEKPYNRKYKTPATTITDRDSLSADKVIEDTHRADAYEDVHSRELDRHGNQGIQTAAQMMALDESWWNKNRWLSQMALDIVNLICKRVEAI